MVMGKNSIFAAPHFQNDDDARKVLESILWPEGPVCPHCGVVNHVYLTKRPGVFRCAEKECRKDFTVTMRTVMERSKIALHKWLQAFHLVASSKKGVSAHQLHRTLNIGYEAAWFMHHRIREAMRDGGLAPVTPMGGSGKIVEADETYFGSNDEERPMPAYRQGRPYKKGSRGPKNKRAIVSLVERGGNVRSFHVAVADATTVANIVSENIHHETRLHTDESRLYTKIGADFAAHETINHSAKEYARGDVTTNSVEGYFSIFKRGMKGVYQHCGEKHLHRYLAEFDFRFNHRVALGFNDGERMTIAVSKASGKRLTYRQPH
jgi:transposase-like protein